jgi:hypothetical protein
MNTGTEFVVVHSEAAEIAEGIGAGDHGLSFHSSVGCPWSDLVGNHTPEIILDIHIINEAITTVGIGLEPEPTGIKSPISPQANLD